MPEWLVFNLSHLWLDKLQRLIYTLKLSQMIQIYPGEAMIKESEWILNHVPLFHGVSESTLMKLFQHEGSRKSVLSKGEALLKTGEPNDKLILILKGKAEARKGSVLLRTFSAGDVTGVSTLFGEDELMESDIVAQTSLEVIAFPREAVREALRLDAAFSENYIAFLSTRIRFLNAVISRCTGAEPAARVARLLYELAEGRGDRFPLNASKAAVALDMSRATFYRALSSLQGKGLITREEGNICISDREGLQNTFC